MCQGLVDEKQLFSAALGLQAPWMVSKIDLDAKARELTIEIDFERGGRSPCPKCGTGECTVHDMQQTTWRHLDFFQFKTLLKVRHPRIKCEQHGVLKVAAPWGRKGSGFSFLFEAMVVALAQQIPMAALARHPREDDKKLWRIVFRHVDEARARQDFSKVTTIGVDEKSSRKQHNYVTFFMDLHPKNRRIPFGTLGKDAQTFGHFVQDLIDHAGNPEQTVRVCIDMSQAFKDGVAKFLPDAKITFDMFHAVKMLTKAMDMVRREDRARNIGLKRSKYLWLRNKSRLTVKQLEATRGRQVLVQDVS